MKRTIGSTGSPPPKRVFLVGDHPVMNEGLALVLGRMGFAICGESEGCEKTLPRLGAARPDLVLVSLSILDGNSLAFIGELHAMSLPVLVYSTYEDRLHIQRAFAAGASGYVTECEPVQTLAQAVYEVLAGRRFLSERAESALLRSSGDADQWRLGNLSKREFLVMQLIGDGNSAYEIARRLGINPHTVASYYARIRQKLGLTGMNELRRYAIRQSRVADPPTIK